MTAECRLLMPWNFNQETARPDKSSHIVNIRPNGIRPPASPSILVTTITLRLWSAIVEYSYALGVQCQPMLKRPNAEAVST
jgi:hypothetical protein